MAVIAYPEPTWGVSQQAVPERSRLRTLTPTPVILTGVMVNLLRLHFVDASNIENTLLSYLLWHPDVRQTRIYIDSSENKRKDVVESVPNIYIKRGAVSAERIGVGVDDAAVHGSSSEPLYQKKVGGIFSIRIESRVPMETEMLGNEVFLRMLRFAPVIRRDIGLGLFQVASLSEVQAMTGKAEGTLYVAVVAVNWSHVVRWSVVEDAPVLKRLSLTANLV